MCGALLMRLEHYEGVRPLLETTWTDRNGTSEPLVFLPGEFGHHLGIALVEPPSPRSNWLSPGWEFLTLHSIASSDWLRERYPELYGDGEPRRSMSTFDVLMCLALGLRDHRAIAFFVLGNQAPEEFALRLYRDPRLRARIAAVLGISLETFDATAPQLLRDAVGFQGGSSSSPGTVAQTLETGSRW